jgi:hypothetical protein
MAVRQLIALTTGTLALGLTASCTPEQVQLGQWYTIYTGAQGTCPALDWHFVVDAHRSIGGYLTRDQFKQIGTLSGTLNADDTFQMAATDPGGNHTERVTGRFTQKSVALSIDGTWICEKQTFTIIWLRSPGLGGGGGD